jgi:alpha-galactosidase
MGGSSGSGGAAGSGGTAGASGSGGDSGAGGAEMDAGMDAADACVPPDASAFQTFYLSDLNFAFDPPNGWGPVERDMSNGETAAYDGHAISIGGVKFTKGLGAHATSQIQYNVEGRCSSFTASVGKDDETGGGSVVFQVFVDYNLVYTSPTKTNGLAPEPITIDLSCAQVLQLIVIDAGDGNGEDHADWADAKITCGSVPSAGYFEGGPPPVPDASADQSVMPDASIDRNCNAPETGALSSYYLSDVNFLGTPTNGWGPVERDMSNGEQVAGDGQMMSINGTTYTKGLGAHAASNIAFDLQGNCTSFTASAGHDDESNPGTVVFEVWLDGIRVYQSPVKGSSQAAESVSVDLTCASKLELVVTDAGDGNGHDHADWADAKVLCTAPPGGLAGGG